DTERYRQRVARTQIGAGGGLQLSLGLVGKSFKSSGRIVAAYDERFRRPLFVWERGPRGARHPCLVGARVTPPVPASCDRGWIFRPSDCTSRLASSSHCGRLRRKMRSASRLLT